MAVKSFISGLIALFIIIAPLTAEDLYQVTINSENDAEILRQSNVEPVHRLRGAYLVIADNSQQDYLKANGLQTDLKARDVSLDELAFPFAKNHSLDKNKSIVFQEGEFVIYKTDATAYALSDDSQIEYIPVKGNQPKIIYKQPKEFNAGFALAEAPLDSLIGLISQDSVIVFEDRLQAFFRRVTGTDSCWAARDWIASKFTDFGYDSVVIDSFVWGDDNPGQNVVAVKVGSLYPDQQVVVGGHYDAVPGSPGADDNASGTVGVLEIARILKDIETEMTFVFIAFDAEETGLNGAHHYADAAFARGDDIVYMLNMDMIAFDQNDTQAKLYYGDEIAYSQLWGKLADSLVNITGVLSGSAPNSDHASFVQNGYDVTFVHEFIRSTEYHQNSDSTSYMDFDYMTRMIKASLATVYTVNNAPPPVSITSIIDGGDGQSLKINWTALDPSQIAHYWLHYTTVPTTQPDSILVPVDSSSYLVQSLTDGQEYSFHLIAYDTNGRSSIAVEKVNGTPHSMPLAPNRVSAKPIRDSVLLIWQKNNKELDFHHYGVIRDNSLLSIQVTDTVFRDGTVGDYNLHDYYIVAIDNDDNQSDTTGAGAISMKAAHLERDRILAINRSSADGISLVNDSISGDFMKEALDGLNYDYYSDTSSSNPNRAGLLNFVDYGIIIISVEGRYDELGNDFNNVYADLENYLSIGGKAIIYGRWGDLATSEIIDTVIYNPDLSNRVYIDYFNTFYRLIPRSIAQNPGPTLVSDFIGAHSQITGYPDLNWNETLTHDHTGIAFPLITGIPCPSIPFLIGSGFEPVYTYNSSTDSTLTEGKTIGWRHLGGTHEYVFFDIPLSFMDKPDAITALQKAVSDLGIATPVTDIPDNSVLPTAFSLSQNYPNPFNPTTTIEFYNPKSKPVEVTVEVFNIIGQRVKLLFNGKASPGINTVEWDGRDNNGAPAATGLYFYRLKAKDFSESKKMILLK
ncbi:MAG: M20/M25/M40 family metallo-hydrolase [candidate division Zixibacteria bacterium]|nr:M20/M25/M40 family metallo-hydrolase [candidate division Zixibacteria bacterium]